MSDAHTYEEQIKIRDQRRRAYQRAMNTEMILAMAGELDFEVKQFGEDHLQIKKGARLLSLYPGTEKAIWLSNPKFNHLTRKGFRVKNVEKFIKEEFGSEQQKPAVQPAPPVPKTKAEEYGQCESAVCGGHYIKRFNKTSGNHFLGCSNYPRCKQTKNIFINKIN